MNNESLIIGATMALVTSIFISSLTGKTPSETAVAAATSVALSPTPYGTLQTLTGYNYGFFCHGTTTAVALKAYRSNDNDALFQAARNNTSCFPDAKKIAGLD